MRVHKYGLVVLSIALFAIAKCSWSQNPVYPTKPVRILTTDPGSGGDLVSRLMAPTLASSLGQQFIVDNRGIISGQVASKSPPDGYTLLAFGSSLWLGPLLHDNVPYDVARDFAPITMAASSPNILVVTPTFPVKSVRELIALAKARPAELNYGASGAGSSNHLSAELFKSMAGVNIVRVFYKGPGAAMTDLISGQVQLMFVAAASGMPHVKTGRLRALAITTAGPSALAPGMPTVASSGLPGYESILTLALFAPSGTPSAIVSRLNQEMVRSLNRDEVRDRLLLTGTEVIASTPEQCGTVIKSDISKWGRIIKDAGIRD